MSTEIGGMHEETTLRELELDLHELCQPLTALSCRLELVGQSATAEQMREVINGGMEEIRRAFKAARKMREHLEAARNPESLLL